MIVRIWSLFCGWLKSIPKDLPCAWCGNVGHRTEMYESVGYGFFCSEDEFEDFWIAQQW